MARRRKGTAARREATWERAAGQTRGEGAARRALSWGTGAPPGEERGQGGRARGTFSWASGQGLGGRAQTQEAGSHLRVWWAMRASVSRPAGNWRGHCSWAVMATERAHRHHVQGCAHHPLRGVGGCRVPERTPCLPPLNSGTTTCLPVSQVEVH